MRKTLITIAVVFVAGCGQTPRSIEVERVKVDREIMQVAWARGYTKAQADIANQIAAIIHTNGDVATMLVWKDAMTEYKK